jgi:hypothetical protein
MSRRLAVLVAVSLVAPSGATRAQPQAGATPPPEQHVRGVVVSLQGDQLALKVPGGKKVTLKLADDARVSVASKADPAAIGQGLFVGTTAVAQPDGTLRAVEVHLFPEAMRGAGEGHRPWDLKPGSSMTNATVATVEAARAPAGSSMTNGTVGAMSKGAGGLKLVLKYPTGEQTVLVPPDVPIVKLTPADRARLVAGAHVFAAGPRQEDGVVKVQRVVGGEGSLRPPM